MLKRLWQRLLIKLGLRVDWENETEINPPVLLPTSPHPYDNELDGKVLPYCGVCGGGPKHQIHVP